MTCVSVITILAIALGIILIGVFWLIRRHNKKEN